MTSIRQKPLFSAGSAGACVKSILEAAIREMAKEIAKSENSNLFNGDRTRRMVYALKELLVKDMDENVAVEIAEQVADIVETLDSKQMVMVLKK